MEQGGVEGKRESGALGGTRREPKESECVALLGEVSEGGCIHYWGVQEGECKREYGMVDCER